MDSMLRFDTVRFVTNSKYISDINEELFKHHVNITTGELISVEFHSKRYMDTIPFELYIRVNYQTNKMTIEFSSKILLAGYPLLISAQTFKKCLLNIEMLGICKLDTDSIVKDCYFNKLHITRDIDLKLTSDILGRLNRCTGEYRRYKWNRYTDGITFTKDVRAADCKETITVYNKEVEIALPRNRTFLNKTGNPAAILGYFQHKTRLKSNWKTSEK